MLGLYKLRNNVMEINYLILAKLGAYEYWKRKPEKKRYNPHNEAKLNPSRNDAEPIVEFCELG